VLFTLVVQGMTMRPLLLLMRLKDDGSVEREVRIARIETARVALRILAQQEAHPSIETLRRDYEARLRLGDAAAPSPQPAPGLSDIQRHAVRAQRQVLMDLRERSVIGDDAFHAAEEELDLLELTADSRIRPTP